MPRLARKRGSHGNEIFDEFYEFGVTIPAATYVTWVDYEPAQWSVGTTEVSEATVEDHAEADVHDEPADASDPDDDEPH